MLKKYKLKPCHVEAIQWDGSEEALESIIEEIRKRGGMIAVTRSEMASAGKIQKSIMIMINDKRMELGDYLVWHNDVRRWAVWQQVEFENTWEANNV